MRTKSCPLKQLGWLKSWRKTVIFPLLHILTQRKKNIVLLSTFVGQKSVLSSLLLTCFKSTLICISALLARRLLKGFLSVLDEQKP